MQVMHISPASEYVRGARARLGQTQTQFAAHIGSTQPMVSKYESSDIDPPSEILMRCMHILAADDVSLISESMLISLVQERLSGEVMAKARATLARLIELLAPSGEVR